jgi:hypothetical protein
MLTAQDAAPSLSLPGEHGRGRRYGPTPPDPTGLVFCSDRQISQVAGGSVEARLDLATGRLRPYLVSGVGLYQSIAKSHITARCDVQFQCASTPGEFHWMRSQSLVPGLEAGLGASLRVGSVDVFTEALVRSLRRDGSSGESWFTPLTIGVRF